MAPNRQNRQLTNQKTLLAPWWIPSLARLVEAWSIEQRVKAATWRKLESCHQPIVSIAIPFATAYDESTLEICNLLYHHINTHHIYIIQMIKKENGSKVVGKVRNIWLCSPQSLQTLDWLMDCHSQESCEKLKFPPNSVSLNL